MFLAQIHVGKYSWNPVFPSLLVTSAMRSATLQDGLFTEYDDQFRKRPPKGHEKNLMAELTATTPSPYPFSPQLSPKSIRVLVVCTGYGKLLNKTAHGVSGSIFPSIISDSHRHSYLLTGAMNVIFCTSTRPCTQSALQPFILDFKKLTIK